MAYNRKLFGVREETLSRLSKLYGRAYFEDRHAQGPADYRTKEKLREEMYAQEFQRIKKYHKDIDKGGKVLDIGCGRGEFLSFFGEKWQKYGIEISDYARRIAEEKGVITDFEPEDDFFDLIIFRGTIQHIPDPVYKMSECYYWLKKGGSLIFLATPNTHGLVYKLFNDLPMIDERFNFLLPSDKMLRQILTNFGFTDIEFEYPYWNTPYARPIRDMMYFILRLFRIKKKINFPFYKNLLECYARK